MILFFVLTQDARNQILTETITEKRVAQDRFLRRVLHEIRTPCNILLQMLESNRHSGATASTTEGLSDHKTMLYQVQKLNDMVKDVADAETFESGKTLKQRLTRFAVLDAMQSAFGDMLEQSEHESSSHIKSTIQFVTHVHDRLLPRIVMLDRKCACRVVRHLLNNARRLTREGSIKFTVSVTPHDGNSDSSKCRLVLKVENTSQALDPVRVHDLFQNYWSMDVVDSTSFKEDGFFDFDGGIGIEMNICFNIVQAMGSQLHFSSTDGINAFWFELTPTVVEWISHDKYMEEGGAIEADRSEHVSSIAGNWVDVSATRLSSKYIANPNEPITRTSKSKASCSHGQSVPRRPHVLVVEDNTICQRVLCRTLQKLDCTSEVAANGAIGCDLVMKHTFDLVFMDLRMPICNGLEACKRMVCELGVRVPIVGFSAEDSPVIHEECLQNGMSEFIVKPAKQERIKEILEQFCDF